MSTSIDVLRDATSLLANREAADLVRASPFMFLRIVVAVLLAFGFTRIRMVYSCGRFLEQFSNAWWLFAVSYLGAALAQIVHLLALYVAQSQRSAASMELLLTTADQVRATWGWFNDGISFMTPWFFAAAVWMLHRFPKKKYMREADISQVMSIPLSIATALLGASVERSPAAALSYLNVATSVIVLVLLAVKLFEISDELATRSATWFALVKRATIGSIVLFAALQVPYQQMENC
jgi:hypothetical protein